MVVIIYAMSLFGFVFANLYGIRGSKHHVISLIRLSVKRDGFA